MGFDASRPPGLDPRIYSSEVPLEDFEAHPLTDEEMQEQVDRLEKWRRHQDFVKGLQAQSAAHIGEEAPIDRGEDGDR